MVKSSDPIPSRAETLKVLRLMGEYAPIFMLGDGEGGGTRWLLHGQPIQPAIARYLMRTGFIADDGTTEVGARKLALTERGSEFRAKGVEWWNSLNWLQKLIVVLRG